VQLNGCKVSRQFVNQYVSVSTGAHQQSYVVHGSWPPTYLGHAISMRAYLHGYNRIIVPKIPDQHVPLRNHTNVCQV